jgi:hypothetical protein
MEVKKVLIDSSIAKNQTDVYIKIGPNRKIARMVCT